MSITLQVNGRQYDGFTSARVFRSFLNFAGEFSFTSVTSDNRHFPIKVGDSCQILIDSTKVLTGYVEVIEITYSHNQHIVTIKGRDRTSDLIDSTIDHRVIFNPPITLKKVIENVLNILGISNIKVIENVTVAPFNVTEVQSATIGDTYFTFLETLCKLRQVILTTDGDGNIVLDQSSKKTINTALISKKNNPQNNIKQSTSHFDISKRFNSYRAYSQGNAVTFVDIVQTPQQLTNKQGQTSADNEIRSSRKYNFISEKATDENDLKNRAIWEANIRRANSKIFSCKVQGFIADKDGFVWRPNLLVQVEDDFSETSGLFLIKDVEYNLITQEGETTNLSLVVKDAFSLQAEQDQRDAKVNVIGKGYIV